MQTLSVIIPIFNEETIIPELYQRLGKMASSLHLQAEFIFVDDGSTDRSFYLIQQFSHEDPRVKYICFTRNFGHQIALQAGLEFCTGDLVVMMDGDLQDPPELIPQFIDKQKATQASVVYGKRKIRKSESLMKKGFASAFYRLLRGLSQIDIPVDTGDFRLITKDVVKDLKRMPEPNKFLRGQVAWLGHKQVCFEYEREAREKGESGFTYRKMIKLGFDGITGFSNFPLKFATFGGIGISMFSFAMIIYVLIAKFVWHEVISGWTSIMVTILFLSGIQLFSIGIIGEYISRINDGVRARPLYVIGDTNLTPPISKQ